MKYFRLLGCLLTLALVGCQGFSKLDWTTLGRGSWQRPDDVVQALEIQPGDRVADLGAGDGYFVPYLSEAVGAQGSVFAVEVDAELVESLESSFAGNGSNVRALLGRTDDPQLPDGSIDLVLIVNTYHHIEDRPAYFERLKGDLGAGGRVAVIDPDADLRGILRLFQHEGHMSRASEIVEEMAAAGYRRTASHDFLATQVFEVFAPGDAGG